jgi:hypothetical protein
VRVPQAADLRDAAGAHPHPVGEPPLEFPGYRAPQTSTISYVMRPGSATTYPPTLRAGSRFGAGKRCIFR